MAVPGSGELKLVGIYSEKNEGDYTSFNADGATDISLRGLSDNSFDDSSEVGSGDEDINLANVSSNRPDGSEPHAMSEFYDYDHGNNSTYWGASNGANGIADFTFSVSANTPGVSALKTILLRNGSGTTDVFLSSNVSGQKGNIDVEMSVSQLGDPGTNGSGTSDTTGFANHLADSPRQFTGQNGNRTYYIRLKYISGGSSGTTNATLTFRNNSVTDTTGVAVAFGQGMSDVRLKTNINRIGYSNSNIPIYSFNYKNDLNTTYKGVMAQDLLELGFDDSVILDSKGFYAVDYNSIDVDMEII